MNCKHTIKASDMPRTVVLTGPPVCPWCQIERLRTALKPFADGADQIPSTWPEHRALLIGEDHPDNPKSYCLLLARVTDFRLARAAYADQQRAPCAWCKEIHEGPCSRLISGGQSD